VPWVKVARVNPVPLPMSIWPLVGVEVRPVPPPPIPTVPARVADPVEATVGVKPGMVVLNAATFDTPPPTAEVTKAVVAIWLVLVPGAAVGAVGVPVNAGE
jgi:hypothetical protein